MRVLLRNTQTGLLYAGRDRWTECYAEAADFETMNSAMDHVAQEKLAGIQILMHFEDPSYEIPLNVFGMGV